MSRSWVDEFNEWVYQKRKAMPPEELAAAILGNLTRYHCRVCGRDGYDGYGLCGEHFREWISSRPTTKS